MARAKPQFQAPALGTPQSAQPQANSHCCRGASAPANSRATPGTVARPPQRRPAGTRQPGHSDSRAAGGGSTSDTTRRVIVAGPILRRDTFYMRVPVKRGPPILAAAFLALSALACSARADEIRLKDGRKLNGVIVAYEDGMFKVKTDYGYELVEKDKITAIIPTTPAAKSAPDSAAKKDAPQHPSKPTAEAQPQAEPAVATASNTGANASPANGSAKAVTPSPNGKSEKASPNTASTATKSAAPANASAANAPVSANNSSASATTAPAPAAAPAPPKEPEVPANREEITGNLYTNYTHGFRMYKAPSWNLIEEARNALPNAIVAMGTSNESTLMVVGEEKTKESLEAAASAVEKRLHDVYANDQRVSQKKTVVGGMPAVDYRYRGKADDRDWSGRLVVIARSKDMLTVLAMTYADSDLIQIQENVIARSIASLEFSVTKQGPKD